MTRQTVPEQPKEMKGIWKPKAEDSKREGEYLRIEPPKEGKEKFGETYILREPSGQELHLPNHASLSAKMKTLKVGWYVWISFIGKDGKTFLYNVEFDNEYKRQSKLNEPMVDYMKAIMEKLTFAGKVYPDGIPEAIVLETVRAECLKAHINMTEPSAPAGIVSAIMKQGLMFESKPGFYRMVV